VEARERAQANPRISWYAIAKWQSIGQSTASFRRKYLNIETSLWVNARGIALGGRTDDIRLWQSTDINDVIHHEPIVQQTIVIHSDRYIIYSTLDSHILMLYIIKSDINQIALIPVGKICKCMVISSLYILLHLLFRNAESTLAYDISDL
jgi:hypothetical protein